MKPCFQNVKKLEFVLTSACTGHCKHCSQGEHVSCGESIDPVVATDAVIKISSEYDIKTVMAFGGEPLLYPDTVFAIMNAAKEMKVPKRQVITNGYFSKNKDEIIKVASALNLCGVNDLLLSVDAFHQEIISLDAVKLFATAAKEAGVPIRLQPAWLVSRDDDNPYNRKTREILDSFSCIGIFENDGNVIFPEGNALKYLSDYFVDRTPENPYIEDPCDVKCISFAPNGDVLDGNVYEDDITRIIEKYRP